MTLEIYMLCSVLSITKQTEERQREKTEVIKASDHIEMKMFGSEALQFIAVMSIE